MKIKGLGNGCGGLGERKEAEGIKSIWLEKPSGNGGWKAKRSSGGLHWLESLQDYIYRETVIMHSTCHRFIEHLLH